LLLLVVSFAKQREESTLYLGPNDISFRKELFNLERFGGVLLFVSNHYLLVNGVLN